MDILANGYRSARCRSSAERRLRSGATIPDTSAASFTLRSRSCGGTPAIFSAKPPILGQAHMRIGRIGMEHHGQPTRGRVDVVGAHAVDHEVACADPFQPGDHARQRGLPSTGRVDEDDEFAVLDVEVDALDDLGGSIGFARAAQLELSLGLPPWRRLSSPRSAPSPAPCRARPPIGSGSPRRLGPPGRQVRPERSARRDRLAWRGARRSP